MYTLRKAQFLIKKPEIQTGEKKGAYFNKWHWLNRTDAIEVEPHTYHFVKLSFKQIKDLNLKADTLNLIEEKVGNSSEFTKTGKYFLNKTLLVQ